LPLLSHEIPQQKEQDLCLNKWRAGKSLRPNPQISPRRPRNLLIPQTNEAGWKGEV